MRCLQFWLMIILFAVVCPVPTAKPADSAPPDIRPGVEVLVNHYADRLSGKRVAILTNPTGVDRNLNHTIDLIRKLPGVTVVRLFAPEHGLRGGFQAGENVDNAKDPVSGLPVVSLHGTGRRPPADSLKDIDILIYDIQDVGHRTYTYISTLTHAMQACEKAGVALWVLDRPDPLGGDKIAGPMIDPNNLSFIGVHNVPGVYGLTPGEWARLIVAEETPNLKLTVVPMQGWRRGMTYGELGWIWVPPSEHIPRWETCIFYAITGTLGELRQVSEGVGTPLPFEQIGAPWMDGVGLAMMLNSERLPGVIFRPVTFRPRYGTHSGKFCQGVQIHLTSARAVDPAKTSAALYKALIRLNPDQKIFAPAKTDGYEMFLKALGRNQIATQLSQGEKLDQLEQEMNNGVDDFLKRREKALIYK